MRFPFLFNGNESAMRCLLLGKFGPGMEGWERSEQDFAEQKTKR